MAEGTIRFVLDGEVFEGERDLHGVAARDALGGKSPRGLACCELRGSAGEGLREQRRQRLEPVGEGGIASGAASRL